MPHKITTVLRHPIMMLIVMIILCRAVKNSYPFNSFPMYADPSPGPSDYLVVSDASTGQALDIKRMAGLSSAKVKKIYTERLNRTTHTLDIKPDEAPQEVRDKVFNQLITQLREAAEKRRKPLPEKVRITNMLIYQDYKDGAVQFREVPQVIGEG